MVPRFSLKDETIVKFKLISWSGGEGEAEVESVESFCSPQFNFSIRRIHKCLPKLRIISPQNYTFSSQFIVKPFSSLQESLRWFCWKSIEIRASIMLNLPMFQNYTHGKYCRFIEFESDYNLLQWVKSTLSHANRPFYAIHWNSDKRLESSSFCARLFPYQLSLSIVWIYSNPHREAKKGN